MMPSEEKHRKLIVEKLHATMRVVMGDPSLVFIAISQKDWDKRFFKYRDKLPIDFPTPEPVRVFFAGYETLTTYDGHRAFGFASKLEKSWRIDIERHPDVSVAIAALFHEWAHVLEPPGRKNHHRRFAKKLQEIETFYLGD